MEIGCVQQRKAPAIHVQSGLMPGCRFQQALHGGVDEYTRDQLDHVLTVHFRGRYAATDVTTLSPEHEDNAIGTNNFKATVHLHHHMAHLYEQYVTMC